MMELKILKEYPVTHIKIEVHKEDTMKQTTKIGIVAAAAVALVAAIAAGYTVVRRRHKGCDCDKETDSHQEVETQE